MNREDTGGSYETGGRRSGFLVIQVAVAVPRLSDLVLVVDTRALDVSVLLLVTAAEPEGQ